MAAPGERIIIEGNRVRAESPEGQTAEMALDKYLERVQHKAVVDLDSMVLPTGVRTVISAEPYMIWVHETPPRIFNLKWIAEDSPLPFGTEASYRDVRIALPYVIVFAVFARGPGGHLRLTNSNECFFRTEPYKSVDDPLLYPGLLNCSRFVEPAGRPLSWICTQHMRLPRRQRNMDDNASLRNDLNTLLQCLFHTGFNYSSEHHEGSSWYSASKELDPRLATTEAWEEATQENPLFVLDVPWLEVGQSVMQVGQRILSLVGYRKKPLTVSALARFIYNHGKDDEASNGNGRGES